VLFHMRDGLGTTQMIVLAARTGFLEQNRAALYDFFEDLVRALHWYLDPAHREEAIGIVAKETGLGPDKITTVVRQGTIDREILDEAKKTHADLIVMSSHRAGLRTYFLGSNAGHVVRYATCSVLVVRQQTD